MAILSFLLVQSLLAARSASAANLEGRLTEIAGNKTLLNEEFFTGWNDQPISRGTSEILWSCLVTLGACIYTAIHLNIPIRHRTKWERVGAKVKWALMALIAPELVVGTALKQYLDARHVCKTLNNLDEATTKADCEASGSKTSLTVSKVPRYQLSYGFWVVMGGFIAETSSIHDTFDRVVLTRKGVELLAREGHQLPMPIEQIADRSKANLLAKSLVCAQVLWMLVQCIARKASGYPLALLELHTMIHVACALAIYGLWWHKPLDVEEPTVVNCSEFMDLLALMLMENDAITTDGSLYREGANVAFYRQACEATVDPLRSSVPRAEVACSSSELGNPETAVVDLVRHFPNTIEHHLKFKKPNAAVMLRTGQALSCGMGPCLGGITNGNVQSAHFSLELNDLDIHRWFLAAQALKKLEKLPERADSSNEYDWNATRYHGCNEAISIRARNWGNSRTWYQGNSHWVAKFLLLYAIPLMGDPRLLYTGMGVLPLFYGGIHLTAWQFTFASTAEATLWKVSCIGIMIGSLIYMVVLMTTKKESPISFIIFFASTPIYCSLIILLKTYIVLEAFLSLRSVPVGVYATISWVQNLPHL